MNKNTVKRLADNPHYTMSDDELDELAQLLREEARDSEDDEKPIVLGIDKGRVNKTYGKINKTRGLEEDDVAIR